MFLIRNVARSQVLSCLVIRLYRDALGRIQLILESSTLCFISAAACSPLETEGGCTGDERHTVK